MMKNELQDMKRLKRALEEKIIGKAIDESKEARNHRPIQLRDWMRTWSSANVGEWNGNAKLTEDQVKEIRRRHAEGDTPAQLAKELQKRGVNIGRYGVDNVVKRKTWKHVV